MTTREQRRAFERWRLVDPPPKGARKTAEGVVVAIPATTFDALKLALRRMPLLLALLIVLFVTSESWQFFGRIEDARFGFVMVLFAIAASIVLVVGLFPRIDDAAGAGEPRVPAKAKRHARMRLLGRLAFETAVVGAIVFGVFFLLGVVAVDRELTETWAQRNDAETLEVFDVHELLPWNREGDVDIKAYDAWGVFFSEPLLRLAALLGAFAALTFAVELFGDETLRQGIVEKRVREYEDAVAAWRAAARALPPRTEPGAGTPRTPPRGSPP
ncbi:MAG: hypothetical protein M3389_01190 [Actinomycetota bacterium]|nr:hypothetical protein [Actinomycetota bacterium]